MIKYLIVCHGFIGDCLFASSIAKALKKWKGEEVKLDYLIPVIQPYTLLMANPNINNVWVSEAKTKDYDIVVNLRQVDQQFPATLQFQAMSGIPAEHRCVDYTIYLPKDMPADGGKGFHEKPVLGIPKNWIEKSFKFTEDEYWRGIDVPHMGYGGKKHDIEYIKRELSRDFEIYEFGLEAGIGQFDKRAANPLAYAQMAVNIKKHCHMVLGPEGGLTNLSAGLDIQTVITTDFIWQLYGPNGIMRKLQNPMMGPLTYFPGRDHVHIQPFADEDEIINTVKKAYHDSRFTN